MKKLNEQISKMKSMMGLNENAFEDGLVDELKRRFNRGEINNNQLQDSLNYIKNNDIFGDVMGGISSGVDNILNMVGDSSLSDGEFPGEDHYFVGDVDGGDIPMVNETDEDIPYAEEVPDDQVPSVNDEIGKVLSEVMDDYAKAKKYIDIEATKLMAGTALDDIIKNINMAKQKERELEKANDYYNAREEYYQDKIDTFHEKYGYDNKVIDEISKYSNGLYYLSRDMYDAAQVWYNLWNIAEKLIDEYNENPKRRKTLINIKSNNI